MNLLVHITGAALIAIGALWWWRWRVSAERPASLLIGAGVGICIVAWRLS